MAIVTRGAGGTAAAGVELTAFGKLLFVALIVWAIIIPFVGMWYGHQVETREWFGDLSAADRDQMQATYMANAEVVYIGGGIIWAAGILALGVLTWRNRARA